MHARPWNTRFIAGLVDSFTDDLFCFSHDISEIFLKCQIERLKGNRYLDIRDATIVEVRVSRLDPGHLYGHIQVRLGELTQFELDINPAQELRLFCLENIEVLENSGTIELNVVFILSCDALVLSNFNLPCRLIDLSASLFVVLHLVARFVIEVGFDLEKLEDAHMHTILGLVYQV